MSEYIITKEQIEELNRANGGMQIVTSWLSCYTIWDTFDEISNVYPVEKSKHIAVTLPEIVRCRDCRYYDEIIHACERFDSIKQDNVSYVFDDGFCAWGERRDE